MKKNVFYFITDKNADIDNQQIVFIIQSYLKTPTVYLYDGKKNNFNLIKNTNFDFDFESYKSKKYFYESKDGTEIPLTITASMVQRPKLFGAVIVNVPVTDMLRYHKFTVGRYWIPEYGDPDNLEHFKFLYQYSLLHNLKKGEKYPSTIVATGDTDDRVVPLHSRKFLAALKRQMVVVILNCLE